jgi:hypothetical protein
MLTDPKAPNSSLSMTLGTPIRPRNLFQKNKVAIRYIQTCRKELEHGEKQGTYFLSSSVGTYFAQEIRFNNILLLLKEHKAKTLFLTSLFLFFYHWYPRLP